MMDKKKEFFIFHFLFIFLFFFCKSITDLNSKIIIM